MPISVKLWLSVLSISSGARPVLTGVPSHRDRNIDELIEALWEKLDLVRVYTKPRGRQPDYSSPVVLKRARCTIEDFCNAIHKEIAKNMR